MPRKRYPPVFVVYENVINCMVLAESFATEEAADNYVKSYGNKNYIVVRYRFSSERMS